MANRRRSERIAVALPVWLKDAQGGERTLTANVSTHGIAVFSPKPRALRQYMELELSLPEPRATISVTAMVARQADLIRPDGQRIPGIGLDFFLFDAQAKAHWHQYLRHLREAPAPTPEEPAAPAAALAPEGRDDDAPTFIIKPRDLGRLWAFYRGELSKGLVRIETPVPKPIGTPVELLVVHPNSQAEWILSGKVARATPLTRMGRPVLEIGLVGLGGDLKAAFRNFVATGRGMIEEDVSVSADRPPGQGPPPTATFEDRLAQGVPSRPDADSERIPSVVIDLDDLDDGFEPPSVSAPGIIAPSPRAGNSEIPVSVEIDLSSEPSLPVEVRIPPELMRAVEVPPAPEPSTASAPVLEFPPDVHVEEDPTTLASEDEAPPRPLAAPLAPDPPPMAPPSSDSGSRSVFASFFAEAAASSSITGLPQPVDLDALDEEPSAVSELDATVLPTVLSEAYAAVPRSLPPPVPLDLDEIEEGTAPEDGPPLVVVQPVLRAAPPPLPLPPVVRAAPPELPPKPVVERAPPPRPAPAPVASPAAGLQLLDRAGEPIPLTRPKPPASPEVLPPRAGLPETARPRREAQARGEAANAPRVTPVLPKQPGPAEASPAPGPRVTRTKLAEDVPQNPPVPPGTVFDFEAADDPAEISADEMPVKAAPGRRGPPPRQTQENQVGHHTNLSTESGNPDLARDIALARARVVRSPHSVTACYRLSMLLVRQGEGPSFEEAQGALQKVLALEPNHPGAHHKLAEVLARRGRFDLAAEHLGRARRLGYRIDPDLELLVTRGAAPSPLSE